MFLLYVFALILLKKSDSLVSSLLATETWVLTNEIAESELAVFLRMHYHVLSDFEDIIVMQFRYCHANGECLLSFYAPLY